MHDGKIEGAQLIYQLTRLLRTKVQGHTYRVSPVQASHTASLNGFINDITVLCFESVMKSFNLGDTEFMRA